MAVKQSKVIPLPPKTQATLKELVATQRMVQSQIEAIVSTARDLLAVPDDYVIGNIEVGFTPPPTPESAAE